MNYENTIKLSVIVPVYNAERYLKQCIESIVNQTYKNIEIILVDDGSTDRSDLICDSYQRIDERVHVIHQENKGCIYARFCGLKSSTGEYIGFVDSDDWIAEDMYKALMSVVREKKCDIVSMGYTTIKEKEKKQEDDGTLFGLFETGKNLDLFLSKMLYDAEENRRGAHPSLCTKVIKRELLLQAFVEIDNSITMGEDASIFYPCCFKAKSIYIMKSYQYYYRVHKNSMCRNISIHTLSEIYSFYQYMQKTLGKYGDNYDLSNQFKNYLWTFLEFGIEQIFHIRPKPVFLFPYARIEKDSDIILYGAGEVGESYYRQISKNHYCNIVAWADKHRGNEENKIFPEQIQNLNNYQVVIAIRSSVVADEIRKELMALGIEKERLLWWEPEVIPLIIT